MARPIIEYVLFDMDGLLLATESVYTEVTNEILAPYGKTMTPSIKAGLMGKLEKDSVQHLFVSLSPSNQSRQFDKLRLESPNPGVPDLTADGYLKAREPKQDERWPTVQLMPGARRLLTHLKQQGIPIALATASSRRNFGLKTKNHTVIRDVFGEGEQERVVCADDVKGKTAGKPDPYIFLYAASHALSRDIGPMHQINVADGDGDAQHVAERARGLVFEDAANGVLAAKRAGMAAVWVPDPGLSDAEKSSTMSIADQTLASLEDFVPEEWGLPAYPTEEGKSTGINA
ncbi:HAD-like protein [Hygrophoropsis aurantiaca]|uniref:HAD-like protein n=1 Tax=Hygrophoropsis aurantiaca TaxID=72124 RepID=A0ACB8A6A0_9AGAM|nr:HAD-like protein [Hygrophoropsis aurantiaca]